ncbi:ATP-grasp fold amidoligase family protein [Cobetia amphilecti]|uniref:ATP-grasp fold amidoligase family protein n=1 Tax=Cobetia amphilecti TaxID=1055104 RepID=A0AAP4WZC5_9GAMM|nr:ATP-grasp fold amidoligase family protein [Cobetia amphilecti]MDO6670836.1 ATP-grasp fold amidoligase family protein [Cobetia amphilecti]
MRSIISFIRKKVIKPSVYFSLRLVALIYIAFHPSQWDLLNKKYRSQVLKVFSQHLLRRRTLPNIKQPKSYNDKLAWIMIYDTNLDKIMCSDKLAMKNYVSKVVGDGYVAKTLKVTHDVNDINPNSVKAKCVVKTNHDSGTVFIISDENKVEWSKIRKKIKTSIGIKYGALQGEWPYQYIKPVIFVEEYLDLGKGVPPDYKFHCCSGEISFVQYIYDRETKPKEVILTELGEDLKTQLDYNFDYGEKPKIDYTWDIMCDIAKKLSANFKYVRVDLYSVKGKVYIGELTFSPRAGCYSGNGQEKLGERLNIKFGV